MKNFYAMLLRMKHIHRWALMRNTWQESLSEHSMDVAVITHALAVIGNRYFDKQWNTERATLLGLFHDAGEIITGDLPTPVKYFNEKIMTAYKQVEQEANRSLVALLPEELQEDYLPFFLPQPEDAPLWRLVKAADKLSALIKCIEEEKAGNQEFVKAKETQLDSIRAMEMEEADYFLTHFVQGFALPIDE